MKVCTEDEKEPYFQVLSSLCLVLARRNKLKSVVGVLEALSYGIYGRRGWADLRE